MRNISFYLVAVFLLFFTRTHSKDLQSNDCTSTCKRGLPGAPGIPGSPGASGRDGLKGEKGNTGKRGKIGRRGPEGSKGKKGEIGDVGVKGSTGIPGKAGPRGFKGSKGDKGSIGTKGSTGISGNTGPRGLRGFKGDKGLIGVKGNTGIPGKSGPRGLMGSKGDKGSMGTKESTGIPGNIGRRGSKGSIGRKGQKGDVANMDPRERANWKQCAWRGESRTDDGKIKECSFNKLHDNTALRVSYQGNVRMYSDIKCNRWYFKFNGNECSGPLPIDSVLYNDWAEKISNLHRNHFFQGYCENLARGKVSVELWVGKCPYHSLGDAYTGWNSVSRIMIEEVPPSQ